jgi:hypothetical protein
MVSGLSWPPSTWRQQSALVIEEGELAEYLGLRGSEHGFARRVAALTRRGVIRIDQATGRVPGDDSVGGATQDRRQLPSRQMGPLFLTRFSHGPSDANRVITEDTFFTSVAMPKEAAVGFVAHEPIPVPAQDGTRDPGI